MEAQNALYIVATPIGNLADITYRAVEVLRFVSWILSEDTRQTKKLLDKYSITTPLKSYRDQTHFKMAGELINKLEAGASIALVSDSGTPLISDPGYKLVRSAVAAGIKVIPIPGPSAVISALSASGLPTDKFSFLGFLPKSSGQRLKLLKAYGALDSTLVVYESPNRLARLLEEIIAALGDREVCVASEMTKLYEALKVGKASQLLAEIGTNRQRGEYTVLIAKMVY